MMRFNITGMSCSACSSRVEKAVSSLPGVSACSVNLLTNSMTVEGNVSAQTVIEGVEKAGYGARLKGEPVLAPFGNETQKANRLIWRLVVSLVILAFLMAVSMGHTMFLLPLPSFLSRNPVALGLVQLLLSATVLVINQRFFINGFKNLCQNFGQVVTF